MDLMGSSRIVVLLLIGIITASILSAGCTGQSPPPVGSNGTGIVVLSDGFTSGGTIPQQFTCLGQNISPAFLWSAIPAGTQSMAILMQDLDAPRPGFTHWIVYNIPPASREIPGNITTEPFLPDGSIQGKNDAGKIGYTGPCPPAGKPHRYVITVYALNRNPDTSVALNRTGFTTAIKGAIIAEGTITGTCQRSLT
jgi:Raf kinase inhibitor-like YbhB/YbcL family protein